MFAMTANYACDESNVGVQRPAKAVRWNKVVARNRRTTFAFTRVSMPTPGSLAWKVQ